LPEAAIIVAIAVDPTSGTWAYDQATTERVEHGSCLWVPGDEPADCRTRARGELEGWWRISEPH
jgi:hypothetical protein